MLIDERFVMKMDLGFVIKGTHNGQPVWITGAVCDTRYWTGDFSKATRYNYFSHALDVSTRIEKASQDVSNIAIVRAEVNFSSTVNEMKTRAREVALSKLTNEDRLALGLETE